MPFSPSQCKQIITEFSRTFKIFVQSSDIRCFSDEDYLKHGIPIVDNLESCDVFFGIKEVLKIN